MAWKLMCSRVPNRIILARKERYDNTRVNRTAGAAPAENAWLPPLMAASHQASQEIILSFLALDRRIVAVPRNHDRLPRQRQQLLVNRLQNLLAVPARQIGAPDAVAEQRIPR